MEIQYRVWDKRKKKMSFFSLKDALTLCFNLNFEEYNQSDIMRYTGVDDKYGRKIFFGDFLEHTDVDGDGEVCKAMVVETIGGGAGINIDNSISDLWEDELVHTFVVIGNIHENPELLESDEIEQDCCKDEGLEINLDKFKKNPVQLSSHDNGESPIGKLKFDKDGKRIVIETENKQNFDLLMGNIGHLTLGFNKIFNPSFDEKEFDLLEVSITNENHE